MNLLLRWVKSFQKSGSIFIKKNSNRSSRVSIHPMFRFKKCNSIMINISFCVSIHPMFRFKTVCLSNNPTLPSFQYILCFGSRMMKGFIFFYYVKVSIHPMFRFKSLAILSNNLVGVEFQYILCFGSRCRQRNEQCSSKF